MGRHNRTIGVRGEHTARLFLKRRGYRILGNNIRTPFGEIDIIARMNDTLVFFEVKTKVGISDIPPQYAVTKKKEHAIINNAQWYLKRYGCEQRPARIDVIAVVFRKNGSLCTLEHFVSAIWQKT